MIALHNVDLNAVDLKTVMKGRCIFVAFPTMATDFSITGINVCFEEKNIFTGEVLAVVMQMLIEQTPLPTLLMRTVIQSLTSFPRLINFVMNNILQRLILKQVWTQKKVWEGFIKCCQRTMPQSFPILLQLPAPQLASVFEMCPELKPSLATFISEEQQVMPVPQHLLDVIYR